MHGRKHECFIDYATVDDKRSKFGKKKCYKTGNFGLKFYIC